MTTVLLDAALDYGAHGFRVLPVYGIRPDGRCACGGAPNCTPGKHPITAHGLNDASADPTVIRSWWTQHPDANIGIATGTDSRIVALDLDGDDAKAALFELEAQHGDIPATVTSNTARGHHLFFRHPGQPVKNATALHGHTGIDFRGDGGYVIVPPSKHASGKRYEWAVPLDDLKVSLQPLPSWLFGMLSGSTNGNGHKPNIDTSGATIPDGTRSAALASMAGTMRRRGMTQAAIEAALLADNAARCAPPLPDDDVRAIAASVSRYEPAAPVVVVPDDPAVESWPDPPAAAAYSGVLGDLVRVIEPHTEADPVAILAQLLVGFGNLTGGGPYFRVEGTQHRINEYLALVGRTAGGRKGTAWDQARRPLAAVDDEWARERVQGGLASGEGLIHSVRDRREERKPVMEKGRVVDYTIVETDAGVTDKRLLDVEPELARVLRVMMREGSTLSTILRQAWDGPVLRVMAKNAGAVATGAHVSIIAHITGEELIRQLQDTEAASGFGNRFLWLAVQRSKLLPEGSDLDTLDLAPMLERLRDAIASARRTGEMKRDDEARALWRSEYPRLTAGKPGLLGAMTSRAEAHVLRLSMIYALAGASATIKCPHLEAALALWNYSARSCAFIFGETLGDPTADELLRALRAAPDGMTRNDIKDHFSRNKSSEEIGRALTVLARQNLAAKATEKPEGPGRPTERWRAVRAGEGLSL